MFKVFDIAVVEKRTGMLANRIGKYYDFDPNKTYSVYFINGSYRDCAVAVTFDKMEYGVLQVPSDSYHTGFHDMRFGSATTCTANFADDEKSDTVTVRLLPSDSKPTKKYSRFLDLDDVVNNLNDSENDKDWTLLF